jgi:hypothetical protein
MFKYTVRARNGKVIGHAMTREAARDIKKTSGKNSYIKSKGDAIYPLKEES